MPHRRERERERDLGQKKYVDRGIIREGEEIDWNYLPLAWEDARLGQVCGWFTVHTMRKHAY